ncbi:hypothetical protein AF71_00028880 [Rhizobium sp. 57MFTsu3.2]|nr:hypothetical protein [Rhizobium sp. 57MFTsu3.2]
MSQTTIREARSSDVAALVAIFAADELGGHGDTTAPEIFGKYLRAFERIASSPDQTLYVAERDGQVRRHISDHGRDVADRSWLLVDDH